MKKLEKEQKLGKRKGGKNRLKKGSEKGGRKRESMLEKGIRVRSEEAKLGKIMGMREKKEERKKGERWW